MASPYGFSQTGIELLNAELAKRGISPAAASGAIAGIMGESGANLNPTSFNTKDPGGGSGGIGQWNRDRLIGNRGLLAFAQNAGVSGINTAVPTDAKKVPFAIQAQYLGHELDTTYAGVAAQLRNATSPQQALNIWVNSYENPKDKAAAIAQRSQYLAPVSAHLSGAPLPTATNGSASGVSPPSPSGGAAAPAASTPGTTINTTGAGGGGAMLPGFADAKTSNQFLQNLDQFDKSLGGRGLGLQGQGQGEGQGQPDMPRAPVIPPPGLRNASSGQSIGMAASQMLPGLTHYQPQAYGQTLNSDPLAIGAGTPQQPDWLKNAGLQQPSPYGTSIGSMQMAYGLSPQQLQMLMNPMMLSQSGGFS